MSNFARSALCATLVALTACSTPTPAVDAAADVASQSDASVDTATLEDSATSDTAAQDAASADSAQVPLITEALTCRFSTPAGVGAGTMQRHSVDTTRFPDAVCNDGSPAIIHFRPFRGAANRNKWVIALRGGGSCVTGVDCAARWCGCSDTRATRCPSVPAENRTAFTADNMINNEPALLPGTGIMLRDGGPTSVNPIEDYNHVLLQYCTSDFWTGTRRDAVLTAPHPVTGVPTQFRLHFLGARVLDADISTLRQDGVPALVHTIGGRTDMPDLDDAEEIIFTGDSAGGQGVMQNLDRLDASLRTTNTRCTGGACPLRVRALIDAAVGPSLRSLDWSATALMTYDGATRALADAQNSVWGQRADESCLAMRRTAGGAAEAWCADGGYVMRNHVTTPYFVRQALADVLIYNTYQGFGARDSMLGALSALVFPQVLARDLAALPMLPMTAAEGSSIRLAPGVFAPGCLRHDTIFNNDEVYTTTISPSGGAPLKLFDVFGPWLASGAVRAVIPSTRAESSCAM